MQKIVIQGKLPSRNELENYARIHWAVGHKKKKEMTDNIAVACKVQNLQPYDDNQKIKLLCRFYEKNNRRDADNIFSGAIKAILDGMVQAGISKTIIKTI